MANDKKDSKDKTPLDSIRSSAWARSLAIAKVYVKGSSKAAGLAAGQLFRNQEARDVATQNFLIEQVTELTKQLGELKGSLMKVGQSLSMLGESFFPAEVNAVLRTLQSDSPPMSWQRIEEALTTELGEKLKQLEIDPAPLAAASLGQAHRARIKTSGEEVVLKIQYPGVAEAIDGDIKTIKTLFRLTKILPDPEKFDMIAEEVREMLLQELDYVTELRLTEEARHKLGTDPVFVIPKTYAEFSTSRVLTTEYMPGVSMTAPEVAAEPQDVRNLWAQALLALYFKELYVWGFVQTDAHFGNYRVNLETKKIALLDFGAVRKVTESFTGPYVRMVKSTFVGDQKGVIQAAGQLGYLDGNESAELQRAFFELCRLIMEPFSKDNYDWAGSDLPKRAAQAGSKIAVTSRLKPPPPEVVFLDRKMGGIFIQMATLRARFDARTSLERALGLKS